IRWVKLSKAGSDPAASHTDRPTTLRSIGNEGRLGLPAHSVLVGLAKDRTSDRSQFRSSIASIVQFPVLKLPFFGPRGAPGLRPPCRRHRLRPRIAGRWHGVPVGVLAPHRGASSLRARLWSIGVRGLIAKFSSCPPPHAPAHLSFRCRSASQPPLP